MKMENILNGLSFGTTQKVGVMSVIPLIGEDVKTPMGDLNDIQFDGTQTYGTMVFTNKSEKPVILPNGLSAISNELAQDHGNPFAYLLKPNRKEFLDFTCCIQQHQGGYLSSQAIKSYNILPLFVRKKHFQKHLIQDNRTPYLDFGSLWSIITEFQGKLIGKSEAHLVYFFTKFVDQLNRFNAEFESVPNQRGAIIMLNDKVLGIEITPTNAYWKTVWQQLIRDCYGSEVIRLTFLNLIKEFETNNELDLDLSNCSSIEEIENTIRNLEEKQKSSTKDKVDNILSKEFITIDKFEHIVQKNDFDNIKYSILKTEDKQAFGELYNKGEETLYCSLLLA